MCPFSHRYLLHIVSDNNSMSSPYRYRKLILQYCVLHLPATIYIFFLAMVAQQRWIHINQPCAWGSSLMWFENNTCIYFLNFFQMCYIKKYKTKYCKIFNKCYWWYVITSKGMWLNQYNYLIQSAHRKTQQYTTQHKVTIILFIGSLPLKQNVFLLDFFLKQLWISMCVIPLAWHWFKEYILCCAIINDLSFLGLPLAQFQHYIVSCMGQKNLTARLTL